MRRSPARLHGLLVVDKPAGLTSHDVVDRVRRLTGERRVGHTGTLDPAATGVLPVCVGQATRLIEYLADADKTYLATIVLGIETDTHDGEGTITRTVPVPPLTAVDLDAVLASFRGEIEQVPPVYSALKRGGRPLYELARKGVPVEVAARRVAIHELVLLDWSPPTLTLRVTSSKGTYIRSLARDIGAALGCGAYLHGLRRTRVGPFGEADAWPLDTLIERLTPETWWQHARPPDALVLQATPLMLDAAAAADWRHGTAVAGPPAPASALGRAYGPGGVFLGVGRYDARVERWQPEKVLSLEPAKPL